MGNVNTTATNASDIPPLIFVSPDSTCSECGDKSQARRSAGTPSDDSDDSGSDQASPSETCSNLKTPSMPTEDLAISINSPTLPEDYISKSSDEEIILSDAVKDANEESLGIEQAILTKLSFGELTPHKIIEHDEPLVVQLVACGKVATKLLPTEDVIPQMRPRPAARFITVDDTPTTIDSEDARLRQDADVMVRSPRLASTSPGVDDQSEKNNPHRTLRDLSTATTYADATSLARQSLELHTKSLSPPLSSHSRNWYTVSEEEQSPPPCHTLGRPLWPHNSRSPSPFTELQFIGAHNKYRMARGSPSPRRGRGRWGDRRSREHLSAPWLDGAKLHRFGPREYPSPQGNRYDYGRSSPPPRYRGSPIRSFRTPSPMPHVFKSDHLGTRRHIRETSFDRPVYPDRSSIRSSSRESQAANSCVRNLRSTSNDSPDIRGAGDAYSADHPRRGYRSPVRRFPSDNDLRGAFYSRSDAESDVRQGRDMHNVHVQPIEPNDSSPPMKHPMRRECSSARYESPGLQPDEPYPPYESLEQHYSAHRLQDEPPFLKRLPNRLSSPLCFMYGRGSSPPYSRHSQDWHMRHHPPDRYINPVSQGGGSARYSPDSPPRFPDQMCGRRAFHHDDALPRRDSAQRMRRGSTPPFPTNRRPFHPGAHHSPPRVNNLFRQGESSSPIYHHKRSEITVRESPRDTSQSSQMSPPFQSRLSRRQLSPMIDSVRRSTPITSPHYGKTAELVSKSAATLDDVIGEAPKSNPTPINYKPSIVELD